MQQIGEERETHIEMCWEKVKEKRLEICKDSQQVNNIADIMKYNKMV
jgi:hypothetical protein